MFLRCSTFGSWATVCTGFLIQHLFCRRISAITQSTEKKAIWSFTFFRTHCDWSVCIQSAMCTHIKSVYLKKNPTKTNLDVEVFQSVENYRDIYVHVMRMFCLAIVWVTESFPNLLFFISSTYSYYKWLNCLLAVICHFETCSTDGLLRSKHLKISVT